MNSFIKSALRKASTRWPPQFEALKEACIGKAVNPASGRLAKFYECEKCEGSFVRKDVQIDHIEPVVPLTGFNSWDEIIKRMFVEKEGYSVLCRDCHKEKTLQERKYAREQKESSTNS